MSVLHPQPSPNGRDLPKINTGHEETKSGKKRLHKLARMDVGDRLEQKKTDTAAGKIAQEIASKVEEIRTSISKLNNEIETQKDRIIVAIDKIFDSAKGDFASASENA